MDVPTLYKYALLDSGANAVNYPISIGIVHLNMIYRELIEEVNKKNENYFYKRFYLDSIPFENAYPLPIQDSTFGGQRAIKKINAVNVLYQLPGYPDFEIGQSYNQ